MKPNLFVRVSLVFILITVGLLWLPTLSANAQTTSSIAGIGVSPSYQEIVVSEDDEYKSVEVIFYNNTQSAITLNLIPVQFDDIDPDGRIFIPNIDNIELLSIADFIRLSVSTLEISAGAKASVEVYVLNNKDLGQGGHYVAIIARQINGETVDSNIASKSKVLPMLSSLLLIRREGQFKVNLQLSTIKWPRKAIESRIPEKTTLLIKNEGNVQVIPRGLMVVKDVLGRVVYRGVVNPDSRYVLHNKSRYIDVPLKPLRFEWPVMFYSVDLNVYETLVGSQFTWKDSFLYMSPAAIGILVVLTSVVIFLTARMLIKRHAKKD